MKLMMIAALVALPAAANAYVSDEGHEYRQTCTADGVVLRSAYPVARQIGAGAGRKHVNGHETIYLGKDCDALNLVYGAGEWSSANGGFWVTFADKEFSFGGQELFCPKTISLPKGTRDCRR